MTTVLTRHFQKKEHLSVKNPEYQRILDELFLFFVRNDHVQEDITVQTFLPGDVSGAVKTGVISAKGACVVAGVEEVEYLARKHTKLTPKALVRDGKRVATGTKIILLAGTAQDVLVYERVFVNILQRMSGIATETARYVEQVNGLNLKKPPLIAATRKTPWMHIDKKAVAVGGGITHRLNLQDGILLKDNHLDLLQQEFDLKGEDAAISCAISNAKILNENIAVEVEVKTEEAAFASVAAWQKLKRKNPFIILLDNFTPARAEKIIKKIKKYNKDIFFEASGGISLENVAKFADVDVDVISIGSLTHSPRAVDLSLDLLS